MVRDHQPVVIEDFNGFWARGAADECPPDHFYDCNNIQFFQSGFETRDGIDTFVGRQNVIRMYTYNTDVEGLLMLDSNGNIYHVIPSTNTTYLVLSISGMTDFGFVNINQRAYISPSTNSSWSGMTGKNVYVYKGNGTPARVAGGAPPTNADGLMTASNSGSGHVEAGIHVFGVVYETDTGFLTQIGPDTLPTVTATGTNSVLLSSIPISPNSYVTKRHLVASVAIDPTLYTGNTKGYQLFFIPDGVINDNTTTSFTVDFYDSELLDDASHLLDLYTSIPAGGGLGIFHNRLLCWNQVGNETVVLVSYPGEPEAIDQVSGLLVLPRIAGRGITHCQEYRDVLYVARIDKLDAFTDNGDVPSSWQSTVFDNGIGCGKHGICTVHDSGGIDIDYFTLLNDAGIFICQGILERPELSYKIRDWWTGSTKDDNPGIDRFGIAYRNSAVNDTINQRIYICLPIEQMILMGDYSEGFNYAKIKWTKWTFTISPADIALFGIDNTLVIAG